jgi:hypothetical protein
LRGEDAGDGVKARIGQTVNTTIGQRYLLSYFVANDACGTPPGRQLVSALVNNKPVDSVAPCSLPFYTYVRRVAGKSMTSAKHLSLWLRRAAFVKLYGYSKADTVISLRVHCNDESNVACF